jgi:hypothetical protein
VGCLRRWAALADDLGLDAERRAGPVGPANVTPPNPGPAMIPDPDNAPMISSVLSSSFLGASGSMDGLMMRSRSGATHSGA